MLRNTQRKCCTDTYLKSPWNACGGGILNGASVVGGCGLDPDGTPTGGTGGRENVPAWSAAGLVELG
jgi:hypothetical protein